MVIIKKANGLVDEDRLEGDEITIFVLGDKSGGDERWNKYCVG